QRLEPAVVLEVLAHGLDLRIGERRERCSLVAPGGLVVGVRRDARDVDVELGLVEQLRRRADHPRVEPGVVDHDVPAPPGQLPEAARLGVGMEELAVGAALVVGRQVRIAVAVEVLDLDLERQELLAPAAVEDRDLVAARDGGGDGLGTEEAGAAEDQDLLLAGDGSARCGAGLWPHACGEWDAEHGTGDRAAQDITAAESAPEVGHRMTVSPHRHWLRTIWSSRWCWGPLTNPI